MFRSNTNQNYAYILCNLYKMADFLPPQKSDFGKTKVFEIVLFFSKYKKDVFFCDFFLIKVIWRKIAIIISDSLWYNFSNHSTQFILFMTRYIFVGHGPVCICMFVVFRRRVVYGASDVIESIGLAHRYK